MPKQKKPQLTCTHKKFLLKDEIKASREYKKYGWPKLSTQESQHHNFIKNQPCRGKKK